MKKRLILCLLPLLLCACADRAPQADALRARYAQGFSCQCTARQIADGILSEYTLSVECGAEESRFALLSPESHRGITARVTAREESYVAFDGTELLIPGDARLSVFTVLHSALCALPRAVLSAVGEEDYDGIPCFSLFYATDLAGLPLSHHLLLARDDGRLVFSESFAGENSLSCTFTDCAFPESAN